MAYLGKKLKELKKEYDYTTKELAAAADVSVGMIDQTCGGRRIPSVKTVVDLAAALDGCSAYQLICARAVSELEEAARAYREVGEFEKADEAEGAAERFKLWSGFECRPVDAAYNKPSFGGVRDDDDNECCVVKADDDYAPSVRDLAELLDEKLPDNISVDRLVEMQMDDGSVVYSADLVARVTHSDGVLS